MIPANEIIPEQITLFSSFSAGVTGALTTTAFSTSRSGSTEITSSGAGCIFALMNGRHMMITATIIRFHGANIVCDVDIT